MPSESEIGGRSIRGAVSCIVLVIAFLASCQVRDQGPTFRSPQASSIQYYRQHYSGFRDEYAYVKQARRHMKDILASPATEQQKDLLTTDLEDLLIDGPHFSLGQLVLLDMGGPFLVEHSSKRAAYLRGLALKIDRALTDRPHDQGIIAGCVVCIEMLERLADAGITVSTREHNVDMKQWAMLRDAVMLKLSVESKVPEAGRGN